MLKRRDWLLLSKDGGDSSSDSESEEDVKPVAAQKADGGSAGEQSASDASQQDASEQETDEQSNLGSDEQSDGNPDERTRQWQMPSDSDGDAGSEGDNSGSEDDLHGDREAGYQIARLWLQARASEAAAMKGAALRCRVCPSVLLLSAEALQTHVKSKKHKKASGGDKGAPAGPAEGKEGDDESYLFVHADEVVSSEEETETHAERLERLEKLRQQLDEQQAKSASKSQKNGKFEGMSPSQARRERRKQKKAAIAAKLAAIKGIKTGGEKGVRKGGVAAAPATANPGTHQGASKGHIRQNRGKLAIDDKLTVQAKSVLHGKVGKCDGKGRPGKRQRAALKAADTSNA